MRRGLKLLGVLAVLASVGMAGQEVYAACNAEGHNGYPVLQCSGRAYFDPPPAGSGPITLKLWQLSFGNAGSAPCSATCATNGSGFQTGAFIGNDSGSLDNTGLDLVDAQDPIRGIGSGAPAGSTCLGAVSNWISNGWDGCGDNSREGLTATYGSPKNDNILNPFWGPTNGLGTYINEYQLDNPMGALMTEGNAKSFALAFFATRARPSPGQASKETDPELGDYDVSAINTNGAPNLATPGVNNVIPWQPIPQPNVSASFVDPGNTASNRILTMSWNAVRFVHDGSVRPSGDTTLFPDTANGGSNGVGVLDQGSLIRYAVETAPILDASGACGSFGAATSTRTTSATVTVPPDTCVRLTSIFGRTPQQTAVSITNARRGLLGDLGYSVTSRTVLIGGALVSNQLRVTSARKVKSEIEIAFTAGSELSSPTYTVHGVSQNGKDSVLSSVSCSECTSGLGSSYSVLVSGKGGVKSVYVMSSTGDKSNVVEVQ